MKRSTVLGGWHFKATIILKRNYSVRSAQLAISENPVLYLKTHQLTFLGTEMLLSWSTKYTSLVLESNPWELSSVPATWTDPLPTPRCIFGYRSSGRANCVHFFLIHCSVNSLLAAWNPLWWDYLHHRNQQILQIEAVVVFCCFYFFCPEGQLVNHVPACHWTLPSFETPGWRHPHLPFLLKATWVIRNLLQV